MKPCKCRFFPEGLVVYIRYRQVRKVLEENEFSPCLRNINIASLILGLIASFGTAVVGNFQETNIFEVHVFGASKAFGLGTVYTWIQVKTNFKFATKLIVSF